MSLVACIDILTKEQKKTKFQYLDHIITNLGEIYAFHNCLVHIIPD